MTLDQFVGRLASGDPVPGGGAASALAASLGGALVAMVAALSEGREKYAAHAATHAEAGALGRDLAARFLTLAEADAEAFSRYSAALKLPRDTDDEKAARSKAIREAARGAAEVPMECVEACVELLAAAEALAGRSNRNASSDLSVATLLGEAAARGAAANVMVNLPAVGDQSYAGSMTSRVVGLLREIETLGLETREIVIRGAEREPLPPRDAG